ncbi:methionyl-tRNA formyltransferase [Pelagibacteraceae bacterium]|jgi:methionyl-tRNA formyltransferase|nr:methionyl-tRNA formyltransferase [Pelagibacteraceae bacterium]|tara:strand:+ start:2511 stop:3431 length:921 start_codon:yes stop_codon:yes gene_type:complete
MSKKIVFMGTPEFSVQTLEVLAKSNYLLDCVYTQPPKKSSRGQKINLTPVHKKALEMNFKIKTPKDFNNDEDYNYLKSLSPFVIVVVAYGQIIPERFLKLPEKGFINIHASLLPKWRGAAPIQRSIMNQEKTTGISFMKIEKDLDTGPYMKQIKVSINDKTNSKNLSSELSSLGAKNILGCLERIEKGNVEFCKQVEKLATYAKKIKKSEARLSWNDSAKKNIAKINGLNPDPGAWFEYDGNRYKILQANISKEVGKPGEVLSEELTIACKDKAIQVTEIQKEGKKKLSIKEFLAGSKIPKGKIFL